MLKVLIISLLMVFGLTGCVAPSVIQFDEKNIQDDITKETYKVKNTSVQIKELSEEKLEKKYNDLSIGRPQHLYPKSINYTASKEVFLKYFNNVSENTGDIIVETKVKDFFIGAYPNLVIEATTKVTIYVKVTYRGKVLIDKDYSDTEYNGIIATKDNGILVTEDTKKTLHKQIALAMVDVYQEQVIPELIQKLKDLK